jgi:hypothetical protein
MAAELVIPEGYRLLAYGEFVPASALYLSNDGTWRPTPSEGNHHTPADGIIYIVPDGVGLFANPVE